MTKRISLVMGLSLLVGVSFNSCIKKNLGGESDSSIVVVGNGLQGKGSLVATVQIPNQSLNQSVIIESEGLTNIQDRLADLKAKDSKSLKSSAGEARPVELDWIVPTDKEGQTYLRLSEAGDFEHSADVVYLKSSDEGVEKAELEKLEISRHDSPKILSDGSMIFLAKDGSLRVSYDSLRSLTIAKAVTRFFVDGKGSLFFSTEDDSWFYCTKNQVKSAAFANAIEPKFLSQNVLVYLGRSGSVYLYAAENSLKVDERRPFSISQGFYAFDSEKGLLTSLWKSSAAIVHKGKWTDLSTAIQNDSLYFIQESERDGRFESRLIQMSADGLTDITTLSHAVKKILSDEKGIFLKTSVKENVKNPIEGVFCVRQPDLIDLIKGEKDKLLCRSLGARENEEIRDLVLVEGSLIVSKTTRLPELSMTPKSVSTQSLLTGDESKAASLETHQVVRLNSDPSSETFGATLEAWKFDSPVTKLEYYEIPIKKPEADDKKSDSRTDNPLKPSPSP